MRLSMSPQLEDIEELSESIEPAKQQPSRQLLLGSIAAGSGVLYIIYKFLRLLRIPQTLFALGEFLQGYQESDGCCASLVKLASAIGFLLILCKLISLARSAYRGVQWYLIEHNVDFIEKYGKWACIAGATDGVGFGMARELARRGHSIVALGRDEAKLARTKLLLEAESSRCEVVTVKIDLSDSSPENFEAIVEKISPEERDIGILINSAGICANSHKRFHCFELDEIRRVVNVNALAVLYLTRIIMPGMLKRKRGLILNMSSPSGYLTVPFIGVYGPTKALVNSFTQLLQTEYKNSPLDIIYLTGNGIDTKLYLKLAALKSRLFDVSPEAYAKSVFNAICVPGTKTLAGTWTHELKNMAFRLLHFFDWMPYALKSNFYFKRLCDGPRFEEAIDTED